MKNDSNLQYGWYGGACPCYIKRNIVYDRLICASLYGHAFGTLHVCPNNGDIPTSGVQQKRLDCAVTGWVWLNCPLSRIFYYCECTIGDELLSVIRSSGMSGGSNVSNSMENNWNFQNCPFYRGCPPSRGVRSAVFHCILVFL